MNISEFVAKLENLCKIALMSGKNLSSLTGGNSLADSPCIGWCTVRQFGDKRCKGCGRYDFEADSTSGLTRQN